MSDDALLRWFRNASVNQILAEDKRRRMDETQRRVFYSFHYEKDHWRAGQVRNIGVVEGNKPVSDNDWEKVKKENDATIKQWINEQMDRRTCTIVLIGSATAGRKWINYEIEESWRRKMGVVGLHIHSLKDQSGNQDFEGKNPFDVIRPFPDITTIFLNLSKVVKVYNPPVFHSQGCYEWIENNLTNIVEEAIKIRSNFS